MKRIDKIELIWFWKRIFFSALLFLSKKNFKIIFAFEICSFFFSICALSLLVKLVINVRYLSCGASYILCRFVARQKRRTRLLMMASSSQKITPSQNARADHLRESSQWQWQRACIAQKRCALWHGNEKKKDCKKHYKNYIGFVYSCCAYAVLSLNSERMELAEVGFAAVLYIRAPLKGIILQMLLRYWADGIME